MRMLLSENSFLSCFLPGPAAARGAEDVGHVVVRLAVANEIDLEARER
jgi:hypothetical protein